MATNPKFEVELKNQSKQKNMHQSSNILGIVPLTLAHQVEVVCGNPIRE